MESWLRDFTVAYTRTEHVAITRKIETIQQEMFSKKMATTSTWPDTSKIVDPMDQLVALSRYYGTDPEFVIAGGGNTSYKTDDRLFVKASGVALADIDADGFVELDRQSLIDFLDTFDKNEPDEVRENRFREAILAARVNPEKGQRPSVEAALHNLLPGRFTVHTHPTWINMVLCCENGESLAHELFGDDILWLPFTTPGITLADTLRRKLDSYTATTGLPWPSAVVMGNHGIIVSGDSIEKVRAVTDRLTEAVHVKLPNPSKTPFGSVSRLDDKTARHLVRTIGPALRGLIAKDDTLSIVTFDTSDEVMALVGGADGKSAALGGPLCPDQIVYCKSMPVWFEPNLDQSPEDMIDNLRTAIENFRLDHRIAPLVVLVKGLGMFTAGDTYKAARTVRDMYVDTIKVMAGATQLGGIKAMSKEQALFIDNWEVEKYRRRAAESGNKQGRVYGKVAVVTGAAQGFGLEISRALVAEGAHVVLADINEDGAVTAANELEKTSEPGRALGLAINVTDAESIAAAVDVIVTRYGGLDILISNAGVLKAESVKTQPVADFEFVTAVNYTGYFKCVQHIAPVMALQHYANAAYWSDIIQINSKSGLVGSNRNAAYAGSKFGGIGLTQSFALELVEDGIKVNSVCPGNFFDGPLWSDPDNGLLVQYLRAGKVPGAKTIDEVRSFYESKVPMGRGCTTADVMNAIYYIIEQRYETGQAIPVTGGQIMLS